MNRGKVATLVERGRMRPVGQAEVGGAKADDRWVAAYPTACGPPWCRTTSRRLRPPNGPARGPGRARGRAHVGVGRAERR